MEPITTAAIVAASVPYLDALLAGSRDRLKEVGKGLTGDLIDRLHGFWQRLLQVQPKAGELIRADQDPDQRQRLDTLVAEAIAQHPDLAELARQLRPLVQIANQSGGLTQVTGDKGVNIGRDLKGNLTIN
jgi:hypothetical protein